MPGPALLIGHDVLAGLTIIIATFVVAITLALVRWRRIALLGRSRADALRWPRPRPSHPAVVAARPIVTVRVAARGLRAPPMRVAATFG